MADKVIAQTLVTREVHDLDGLLNLLAESDRPIYVSGDGVQGVLLRYQVYRKWQERLEDLEDLLAMQQAEAEYRAGEGRPLDEILVELEVEEAAYVPG